MYEVCLISIINAFLVSAVPGFKVEDVNQHEYDDRYVRARHLTWSNYVVEIVVK